MILEFYILMIFMIITSVVAVQMKGLLSSVISVGAVGLALSMMFLLLQAPDLAITQLVVEILMLIVLIRATIGMSAIRKSSKANFWAFASFLIFAGAFMYAAILAFKEMPVFGSPIMRVSSWYIQNTLSQVKAANIVTAVILDFRAYDTLGEATVLFTSVIGVLVIMRKKGRKKINERDESNS